jgi:hypothetical protein
MSTSNTHTRKYDDLGCYETNLNIGRELYYIEKNYLDARQVFENTKLCYDTPQINDLDKLINEINDYFNKSEHTPFRIKNKWGVVTEDFIYSIKPNWEFTSKISDEFFSVLLRIGGTWKSGVINKKGVVIIPPIYRNIHYIGKELFQVYSKKLEKYQLLLSNGNDVTPNDFKFITRGKKTQNTNDKIYQNNKNNYGIINLSGNIIIKPAYEEIIPFGEYYRVKSAIDKLYGVIKKDGTIVISLLFNNISIYDNYLIAKNANFSVIDYDLKFRIKDSKNEIFHLTNSLLGVIDYSSRKQGIVDEFGNQVYDFIFDSVSNEGTEKEWIKVVINNKYGVINNEGQLIIPPIYRAVDGYVVTTNSNSVVYFCAYLDDKTGVYNKEGALIIARIYDSVYGAYFDFAKNQVIFIVKKNKKFGVVDDKGEIVIDFHYRFIKRESHYIGGLFHYTKDPTGPYQNWGLITYDGIEYTKPIYYSLSHENYSHIFFIIDYAGEKRGIMDKFGQVLFTHNGLLKDFKKHGLYAIVKNNKVGIIDYNLTQIIPYEFSNRVRIRFEKIYADDNIYSLDGKKEFFKD